MPNSLLPVEFILLIILLIPNVIVTSSLSKPDGVKLVNNGYIGVAVLVHEDVPESHDLLSAIEAMVTNASRYMYQATKRRAFLRDVTIVVPKTWKSYPQYGASETHSHDVIITPTNHHWAPDPHTIQYQGCGGRGVHIRVGAGFVTDPMAEEYYGPLGRLLVHEWGHYRWGLFDEYPDPVTESSVKEDFYFSSITQTFHGISCSSGFASRALKFDPATNRYRPCAGNGSVGYEEGCAHVTLDDADVTQSTGSIMYGRQFYEQIVNFCDGNSAGQPGSLHDREAPSRHNRLCGARSCWEVMRQHSDFKDGVNPARDVADPELQPTFSVVQARHRRVVLLLDTSYSMVHDYRFQRLISAAAHFIQSVADVGSHVGVVQYNQVARVCSWLVQIHSEADRQALLDSLPVVSSNTSTSYVEGLLTSLQVLTSDGAESAGGGIVIMFADGVDSNPAATGVAVLELVNNSVAVDTVACAPNPRTLPDIAVKTGGRSFHFQTNIAGLSSVAYHAFAGLMARSDADSDTNRRIMISSTTVQLTADEEHLWTFSLDRSLGRQTEILLTWTQLDSFDVDVFLTSPSGVTIDNTYTGYRNVTDFKLLIISIHGTAEVGQWTVHMRNLPHSSDETVTVMVTSYAQSDDVEPIVVTPMLSSYNIDVESGEHLSIYAEIRQGLRPVTGAEVVAKIYPTGGYPERVIRLLDNGAGADVREDDGVYSRYYVKPPNRRGFNTVQIQVTSGPKTVVLNSTSQPRTVANISPDRYADHPHIGNSTIFAPGTQPRDLFGVHVTNLCREVSGFTAYFDHFPASSVDVDAPCRVQDLRVVEVEWPEHDEAATVGLSWTAPGDDVDDGTASLYDIRYAHNVSTIVDDFESATPILQSDVLRGNLSDPRPAMDLESVTIRVPFSRHSSMPSTMTFALRAADGRGRLGELSNVARATFQRIVVPPPAWPTDPTSTLEQISTAPVTSTAAEHRTLMISLTSLRMAYTGASTSPHDRHQSVGATLAQSNMSRTASRTLQQHQIALIVTGVLVGMGALIVGLGLLLWKLFLKHRFGAIRVGIETSHELQSNGLPLDGGSLFDRMISTSSVVPSQTNN